MGCLLKQIGSDVRNLCVAGIVDNEMLKKIILLIGLSALICDHQGCQYYKIVMIACHIKSMFMY